MAAPFPKIKVSGSPYQRGYQYGRQAGDRIYKSIELYRTCFLQAGVNSSQLNEQIRLYSELIVNCQPEMMDEIKGIAEGSGFSAEQIVALNCRTEILFGTKLQAPECTALAVTPEASANGHTIIAQNWDWYPQCLETAIILEIKKDSGPGMLIFTEAGVMARNGLNSQGTGVVGNFLQSDLDGKQRGMPIPLVRRNILNGEAFCYSVESVICNPRCVSSNYILANKAGEAINLETACKDVFPIYPQSGLLVHANHFVAARGHVQDVGLNKFPDSLYRDLRVKKILNEKERKIEISDIKEALRDHFGYPRSVCRHDDGRSGSVVTVASIIMDLNDCKMLVAPGPPCKNEYFEYILESL